MEQDTRKNFALLANGMSLNPYSLMQRENHIQRPQKGCSGQENNHIPLSNWPKKHGTSSGGRSVFTPRLLSV